MLVSPYELAIAVHIPGMLYVMCGLLVVTAVLSLAMKAFVSDPRFDSVYVAYCLVNLTINDPYCIWLGFVGYFSSIRDLMERSEPLVRLPVMFPVYIVDICRFQMARQMASLFCEFMYKQRNWNMIVHHTGVAVASALCPYVFLHGLVDYKVVFFFGGICEVSTVFLTLKVLIKACNPDSMSTYVKHIYNTMRYLFLVSFVVFRLGWWNVHAAQVLYTSWNEPVSYMTALMAGCMILMTSMQLYWGLLIGRIALKEWMTPARTTAVVTPCNNKAHQGKPTFALSKITSNGRVCHRLTKVKSE